MWKKWFSCRFFPAGKLAALAFTAIALSSLCTLTVSPVQANSNASTHTVLVNAASSASTVVRQTLAGSAQLRGQGELTWLGLKIYDAQLWLPEGSTQRGPNFNFKEQSFALELRYARALGGDAIATRSLGEIQKLGIGTAEQHETWLNAMRKAFPDIQKNDRLTGVYLPERGVAFYLNDRLRLQIDDAQFATAFFSIWFDPKTSAPKLRAALLGLPNT